MRYSLIIAAAALATACTPNAPPPATASATAPATAPVASDAARRFAAAEIEWQSAIAVGRALVARGAIRGTTALAVQLWNRRARTLIVGGKSALTVADQVAATAELLGLVARLDAITGRK